MLGYKIFFHHTLRKMVVAFGSLFKDIYIERRNNTTGELFKYMLVPLSYAPKEKWIYRIKQNPILEAGNVAIILPRMSFQLDSLVYNSDRKLQSLTTNQKTASNNESKNLQYTPVPYDYNFSLYIVSDNAEDGTQILEQVLPFFTPEFTSTVNTVPELGIQHDIPVVLNSVTSEDNFDTDFEQKRMIIWTLQFTMQGYVYGPVKEQGIIRRVIDDLHVAPGTGPVTDEEVAKTPRHVRITIDPDPITAGPNDDFGFKETIEDFDDNKHRDPVTGEDVEIP